MLKELRKNALILLLSLALILFTQWIKNVKNPGSAPLTWDTLGGLFLLGLFALIGILVKHLLSGVKIKCIRDFAVLGWGFHNVIDHVHDFPDGNQMDQRGEFFGYHYADFNFCWYFGRGSSN